MSTRKDFIRKSFAGSVLISACGIPCIFGADNYRARKVLNEKLRIIIETDHRDAVRSGQGRGTF